MIDSSFYLSLYISVSLSVFQLCWRINVFIVYSEQGLCNCQASVRLSVPSGRRTLLLEVCCCGPMLARDIDRLQQRRRANAGSATLSAYVVTRHRLFLQHHYRAAFQLAIADPYQTHLLQVQKRGRAAIGRAPAVT